MARLENNTKPEKPKQLRRKTVADSFIAPLLDSKNAQHPTNKGTSTHTHIIVKNTRANSPSEG